MISKNKVFSFGKKLETSKILSVEEFALLPDAKKLISIYDDEGNLFVWRDVDVVVP